MKVLRFAAFLLAMLFSIGAEARPFRVLASDRTGITLEFTAKEPRIVVVDSTSSRKHCRIFLEGFDSVEIPGEPILPVRRFFFEVPSRDGVRLEIASIETRKIPGIFPVVAAVPLAGENTIGVSEEDRWKLQSGFVRLSGIELVRGRSVAFIDVYPILMDPVAGELEMAMRIVARLVYSEPFRGGTGSEAFMLRDLVGTMQETSYEKGSLKRSVADRTPFEFARSSHWIKMVLRNRGMYIITYNDLLSAGINPSSIDPATIRIFSGGPFAEPDSLQGGGSYIEGYHLTEHALFYIGTGSGSFQPGDTIIFHGVGVDGWQDEYDPSGDPWRYIEHPYEKNHFYWLTWGGSFEGSPRRIQERSVAETGSPDTLITWYEKKMHREEDYLYDPIYTDDNWFWRFLNRGGSSTFSDEFTCSDLADGSGYLRTLVYGPYSYSGLQNNANFSVNGNQVGSLSWTVSYGRNPSNMKMLFVQLSNLREGKNTFLATKTVDSEMYVFWYEISYRRLLRAIRGELDFAAPARPLKARFVLSGFPAEERFLFDVSRNDSPVLCTGWTASAGSVIFEDSIGPQRHRYFAVSRSALRKPTLEAVSLRSLRDEVECADMVIIYHRAFEEAARTIAQHRRGKIDGISNPVVKMVDIEDVYANFSGGHKDPIAIRNFLKFLYDRQDCRIDGDPTLKYVLLIGNGTYDPKNVLGRGWDYIPLYMNNNYSNELEAVEDEDFMVKLDRPFDRAPDLAIGRMSVLNSREASAWARRIVDYEAAPEYGPWREKAILCADDEFSSSRDDDFEFMIATEELARRTGPFPCIMDLKKIYLHLYPFLGDVKPGARNDLIGEWSDGALTVNYNGHGSPLQMADERVMVNSDIYSLSNGMRLPILLSFSCSVGDIDSPYTRSIAQSLVTYDRGGAIGTIAAAAPTYLFPNNILNAAIYRALFTSKDSTGTVPIGLALQLAKYAVVSSQGYESNNSKYLLLGDPAMKLGLPSYRVFLETSSVDTMRTGERYRVEGWISRGGEILSSFEGTANVIVQEAEKKIRETIIGAYPVVLSYVLPGAQMFRGTVDVVAGRFSADFVVPRRCHTGPGARIRVYASSAFADGAGSCDTLLIVPSDTLRQNDGPPKVKLYFAGQATRVKAGSTLVAEISDQDGIAILGSDPQSSIFLEFDGSGYPVFVTDKFKYDHGSCTSGKVEYQLSPGFEPGWHTVAIKAFDNLGASSSDTLAFEVVEEGLYAISDVFNFPNPFSESTNFVFQCTNPANATLKIFTVSGNIVWQKEFTALEGFNSVFWDGRDLAGDKLANGTYLYSLELDFKGSYHRKETVKGKAVILR